MDFDSARNGYFALKLRAVAFVTVCERRNAAAIYPCYPSNRHSHRVLVGYVRRNDVMWNRDGVARLLKLLLRGFESCTVEVLAPRDGADDVEPHSRTSFAPRSSRSMARASAIAALRSPSKSDAMTRMS